MNNNGNKLLDKISDLDPRLITDAEKKPRTRSRLLIGITSGMATVAAAAIIAVAAGNIPAKVPPIVDTSDPSISSSGTSSDIAGSSGTSSVQTPAIIDDPGVDPPVLDFSKYKDLPKITDTNGAITALGGGRTDDMYSWELDHASPWPRQGAELETMPVYMSSSTLIPDINRMYERIKEVIAALGMSENDLKFYDTYENIAKSIEEQRKIAESMNATQEEIDEVINRMIRGSMSGIFVEAQNDDVRISLFTDYSVRILFKKPLELPEGYNFTASATEDERAEALSYLAEKYKGLVNYSDPMPGQADSWGSYIYEADGDLAQQVVNYWINTIAFEFNNNTGYSVIDINTDGALTKLADYPVLTAAQAEAILKSNKYDPDKRMPSDAKIVKTDLVYHNLAGSTAVLPYYEFYVETDEEPRSGYDLVCEKYTIAAVPEEFIDMETTDYGARA